MPQLSFGDGSPTDILSGMASFFSQGGKAGTVVLASFMGLLISIAQGGINILQSIFNLIAEPLDAGAEGIGTAFRAILVEPLGVLITGSQVSAESLEQFGFLAILVGVGLLLAAWWMVTQYLQEEETSDTIPTPGFPDLPFFGVTEEGEDDQ